MYFSPGWGLRRWKRGSEYRGKLESLFGPRSRHLVVLISTTPRPSAKNPLLGVDMGEEAKCVFRGLLTNPSQWTRGGGFAKTLTDSMFFRGVGNWCCECCFTSRCQSLCWFWYWEVMGFGKNWIVKNRSGSDVILLNIIVNIDYISTKKHIKHSIKQYTNFNRHFSKERSHSSPPLKKNHPPKIDRRNSFRTVSFHFSPNKRRTCNFYPILFFPHPQRAPAHPVGRLSSENR